MPKSTTATSLATNPTPLLGLSDPPYNQLSKCGRWFELAVCTIDLQDYYITEPASTRQPNMTIRDSFDRITEPGQSYPTPAFLRIARSRRTRTPVCIAIAGLLLLILGWNSSVKVREVHRICVTTAHNTDLYSFPPQPSLVSDIPCPRMPYYLIPLRSCITMSSHHCLPQKPKMTTAPHPWACRKPTHRSIF